MRIATWISHLVTALVVTLGLAPTTLAEPPTGLPQAQLTGEVVDESGRPIAGARVTVWQAYPREGPAYYCPTCYRDCGRSTQTGSDGRFTIDALDETLKFTLLVTRDGYVPMLTPKVQNPAGEKALRLKARDWSKFSAEQVLHGQVLGEHGAPLPGAIVEPFEFKRADRSGMGGAVEGLDQLAVTDAGGNFRVAYSEIVESISVVVSAPAMARTVFARLKTGETVHRLALVEGAAIAGRLMQGSRPVPGIEIAVYPTRRGIEDQAREEKIATDQDGRFAITNLPPGKDLWLYSKMDSAKRLGAARVTQIHTGIDQSLLDVGDIMFTRGFSVAGRLVLDRDARIPSGKLFLANDGPWDDQIVPVGGDGEFEFNGVPEGTYQITYVCDDKGANLWVSPRNASFPFPGADRLTGTITEDRTDLRIHLSFRDPRREQQRRLVQPWEKPLEGVESLPDKQGGKP